MKMKILKIEGRLAKEKEFKKFLSESHDFWSLIRFTMVDNKTGKTWPKNATPEEAKVMILKQMLLKKGHNPKLLEDFEEAVRDQANRDYSENESALGEEL
jgi:hypothetical protein